MASVRDRSVVNGTRWHPRCPARSTAASIRVRPTPGERCFAATRTPWCGVAEVCWLTRGQRRRPDEAKRRGTASYGKEFQRRAPRCGARSPQCDGIGPAHRLPRWARNPAVRAFSGLPAPTDRGGSWRWKGTNSGMWCRPEPGEGPLQAEPDARLQATSSLRLQARRRQWHFRPECSGRRPGSRGGKLLQTRFRHLRLE